MYQISDDIPFLGVDEPLFKLPKPLFPLVAGRGVESFPCDNEGATIFTAALADAGREKNAIQAGLCRRRGRRRARNDGSESAREASHAQIRTHKLVSDASL